MEKQYQITLTESQHKSIVAILMAINSNRRFQPGSNLRESSVCNINDFDIKAMEYVTDFDNWSESDDPFYVPVGHEVEIDGRTYVCKEYVPDPDNDNECEGCAFADRRTCPNLACSDEDRRDKKSVLWVEKGGES